jgi:RNA polymerase sigma-70 factor (ECF subfamily)
LVQEALCRAWANRGRLHSEQTAGAYLSRILVNTFISRRRHALVVERVRSHHDLNTHLFDSDRLEASRDPAATCESDDGLSDEVERALATLPARYRDVLTLVDLQGYAYKEAAQRLDIPLGTVMSRLHRARKLLRAPLEAYAYERGYVSH